MHNLLRIIRAIKIYQDKREIEELCSYVCIQLWRKEGYQGETERQIRIKSKSEQIRAKLSLVHILKLCWRPKLLGGLDVQMANILKLKCACYAGFQGCWFWVLSALGCSYLSATLTAFENKVAQTVSSWICGSS